jgi:hypothetical protein
MQYIAGMRDHTSTQEDPMTTTTIITRYHLDTQTPVRPPMADAIYHAQLCANGQYRQCVDVHPSQQQAFERWANHNPAVLAYAD